jgi:hypothetical protein
MLFVAVREYVPAITFSKKPSVFDAVVELPVRVNIKPDKEDVMLTVPVTTTQSGWVSAYAILLTTEGSLSVALEVALHPFPSVTVSECVPAVKLLNTLLLPFDNTEPPSLEYV